MTQIIILSPTEKREFIHSPSFNKKERHFYFQYDQEARQLVKNLRKPINRIGCLIQLGYFRATGKFYPMREFRKRDINQVCGLLGIKSFKGFTDDNYASTTMLEHQQKILIALEWKTFGNEESALLYHRATWLAQNQRKPKDVFWTLIDFCWDNQIVVPSYTEISDIITRCYNDYEKQILTKLSESLSPDQIKRLDNTGSAQYMHNHGISGSLLQLKKISQSLKVKELKQSAKIAELFKNDYLAFESIFNNINLSDQATEYFATWVEKSTTHQFSQIRSDDKRHLHLLAFIKHHCFSRQDALADAFMKCVIHSTNKINDSVKEHQAMVREEREEAIKVLSETSKNSRELLEEIKVVVKGRNATPNEKFYKIERIIKSADDHSENEIRLQELEQTLLAEANHEAYYAAIKDHSLSLQNRVSDIIKALEFDKPNTSKTLFKAITYYQNNEGDFAEDLPVEFLNPGELNAITQGGSINKHQYVYLLFLHIREGFKSGKVNLKYSFRYRALSEYLIDKETWERDRALLIKAAGLEDFKHPIKTLAKMKSKLEKSFASINKNYQAGKNPHLSALENGHVSVRTPNIGHSTQEYIAKTLSKSGIIPVQQVLADIDKICQFSEAFEHLNVKDHKRDVSLATIVAGIIAKGCNIGLGKMTKISEGVNTNTLKNTVHWCFSQKNIKAANKKIVTIINNLPLAKNYQENPLALHSSSDGRKLNVAVDSLHAKRSFKYFGKSKGVDIYTFTDESQALFHNAVISSTDRDAPYVIDGLVNNNAKEDRIHSTDEHGFSLSVHATTHFIGVSFAPRFKKLKNKTLHGFSTKSTYRKKGYDIYPTRRINQKIIIEQWDDILRFIATIKLGVATASQLFQRLSSYAKDHPLYKALKEFGGICKTQYILAYCEDVKLRQQVQKMLTRIELSNKFAKAIFFDNGGEFQEGSVKEQEIAVGCKVLIQNAIILHNYLSLSDMILKTRDKAERQEMIDSIKQGSVISWRSINLHGNYSFKNIAANEPRFDLEKINAMSVN